MYSTTKRDPNLPQLLLVPIIMVFILIPCNCQSMEERFGEECKYSGDMGRVDPECLRKMRDQFVLVRECFGLFYGPGLLYTDRSDIEFWITIDKYARKEYADNLTYTVYSKTGDFSTPGSLTWVDSCKSMDLNSRCTLPKRRKGEKHVIYLPVKSKSYREVWYCEFEIEEYVHYPRPRFCKNTNEYDCLVIEDGMIQRRRLYVPLALIVKHIQYRLCVFLVPDDYLVSYIRRGEVIYNTPGITKKGRNKIIFQGESPNQRCTFMQYRSDENLFLRLQSGTSASNSGICFFLQWPERNNKWTRKPVCSRPKHKYNVSIRP